uniref:Uncharacterized protein n=1 Tax=viral metagenome TaxID=1070528 RepID=A0A6M3IXX7_9ZZZZ
MTDESEMGEIYILERPEGLDTWFLWSTKVRPSRGVFDNANLRNMMADDIIKTGSPKSIVRWLEERKG